jgi:hypothetical protein
VKQSRNIGTAPFDRLSAVDCRNELRDQNSNIARDSVSNAATPPSRVLARDAASSNRIFSMVIGDLLAGLC